MKTPAPQRAAGRRALAAKDQALPGGEEPIPDVAYLKKAIRSVGRLDPSKRPALKALIRKRAKELNAMNAPGVKGTWAFEAANDGQAVTLATPMPTVAGTGDVLVHRSGNVTHRSTGAKLGTVSNGDDGWTGEHASGACTDPMPNKNAAVTGLVTLHNNLARKPAGKTVSMAATRTGVELATPAASASDGPRVTKQAGAATTAAPAATGGAGYTKIYKKLIAKGMKPAQAAALAKRASSMHAKADAKAA